MSRDGVLQGIVGKPGERHADFVGDEPHSGAEWKAAAGGGFGTRLAEDSIERSRNGAEGVVHHAAPNALFRLAQAASCDRL